MDTLLTDDLWNAIALFLPEHVPSPKGGRRRVPDQDCLRGILFVLREGIRWQSLPKELGCGSGSTCWRRFQEWTAAGVWHKSHCRLAAALGERGLLNLERVVADSASCRAQAGGEHTGPNPTDRAKKGCKRHLLTDGYGIPLVVTVGPANHRDETAVPELLWVLWMVLGCISGRRRPGAVQADRGYGFPWTIALVLAWGIRSLIARCGAAPTAADWGTRGSWWSVRIELVRALPPHRAVLRAAGGPFPRHAAVGGVCHLRQTAAVWPAACRRVPALRPGCLTVLKPLLTRLPTWT